jgi:hypothetical protein
VIKIKCLELAVFVTVSEVAEVAEVAEFGKSAEFKAVWTASLLRPIIG